VAETKRYLEVPEEATESKGFRLKSGLLLEAREDGRVRSRRWSFCRLHLSQTVVPAPPDTNALPLPRDGVNE
jgi:hypothetical protein